MLYKLNNKIKWSHSPALILIINYIVMILKYKNSVENYKISYISVFLFDNSIYSKYFLLNYV